MKAGLGRRSGAVAALLLALFVAAPAAPATAAADGGPAVTIESPKAGTTLTSSAVTVTVRVTTADLSLYRLKNVTLTEGADTKTFDCPQSPCSVSWELNRPANGTFSVQAVATQTVLLLGTAGPSSDTATRSFAVAAPAAKPTLDAPKVNDARNVELSWTRNTEPDFLYYALFRLDPGATEPQQVGGKIKNPTSGSKVSFTDTATSGYAGGNVTYVVYAVRRGATADSELASAASATRSVTLPPLPTTSTSVAPGAPGGPPANPTTTAKPGTSAGVDLSGFLSSRATPLTPPVITVPEPPDTGFEGTLPFGARPPSLDDIEEGDANAVPPSGSTSIISRISPGRPLVPVAGGLVLLLLAMHMRVLNRRTKEAAAGGDLPVEAATAAATPA
ncbi:MAG TPA: hypothetical protein VJ653_02170, partial [Acidimicrobiales bacterium]|nr:hypothetical protein [Acidimicrobiales bacterium]